MSIPNIEAFDHVAIEVKDLDSAVKFYKEILGLQELVAPPAALEKGIRWFALPEGKMLHLVHDPLADPARVGHVALRVRDVSEWKKHFAAAGIPEEAPTVQLYGTVQRIFVRDPSGNRLEILRWG